MRSTESINVFMGTKIHEKGRNRRKLHKYILQFKARFISQHIKTILKIELQKITLRLSIFAVYET